MKRQRCERCQGVMTPERVWTRQGGIWMVRCLYCGNVVDSVVMANRGLSPAALAGILEVETSEGAGGFEGVDALSRLEGRTRPSRAA